MFPIELAGRRALVTGGSRGIGAACCRWLARAGAGVGVHYHRDEEAARRVAGEVRSHGAEAAVFRADVSDPDQVARLFEAFQDGLGPLDLLVNSAGIWKRAPIAEMSPEQLEETLSVNLKGTFYCCQEAVGAFGGRPGVIVNVSSTAGQRGEAFHSHYAASKGGVQALTKSLAEELGPAVRVNCVAPGWVDTDMARDALQDPDRMDRVLGEIPTGRVATAEDVAGAVLFLASDLSRQITGEILNLNGGSVRCG